MGTSGTVVGLDDIDVKFGKMCYYGYLRCWRESIIKGIEEEFQIECKLVL